uniref:TATA element modulatory factor 1 TATA binding domain-containing protein n=1 Tax=Electrophorus electricus TaxID=8005 RepID=A0AAY5EJ44_ELEEL
MSWFNASHLSSFAKQALTSAQKSIDRVLDIKEEDQWGDATIPTLDDMPSKPVSTGWGMHQWDAPSEEGLKTLPPSSEAITRPVTRTVVDESESFFNAFLSPGDIQPVKKTPVVSVAPTKSYHRLQEKDEEEEKPAVMDAVDSSKPCQADGGRRGSAGPEESKMVEGEPPDPEELLACMSQEPGPLPPAKLTAPERSAELERSEKTSESQSSALTPKATQADAPSSAAAELADAFESSAPAVSPEPKSPGKTLPVPPKDITLEPKDPKAEDRQSDTPSPPVSAFSSGTSTTSDIEVLDHESVISESSASSRQETAEAKTGLHLMQGSFQLLSASTCGDFPRLDDYPKLTESCGSSSDAFERIDSFSMQSLDSRSVSEVNSDDDVPANRTLASVTARPAPALQPPQAVQERQEVEGDATDSAKDQSQEENEMEESGRSATPVNCEQSEDLREGGQESDSCLALSSLRTDPEESLTPPVVDELTSRLEKREAQLLAVSKDKAHLEEECDNLRDEVIRQKEENTSVRSLKDEFTERIAEAERKAQLACKERDIAKKEIRSLREELSTRFNSNETLELIREKEEQIRGLLEEGEKLSKQQLQQSNIIKKLRTKEKESEVKISKQTKKLQEQEDELKQLQKVADLRLVLQRAEQQQARKEDYLREEISHLQQRLQEAETRNQELSQSVTTATRPLLRQIENLQATLGTQAASWEKLEKNISDRLGETQLAVAVEKERSATEELYTIKAQLASLESQNSLLRQEKGRVHGQLDAERARREGLEDESSREHVELENLKGEYARALEDARKEKLLLTNQLEMEKMRVEQEKKKCYLAQEALKERVSPASSTPSLSRSSSISGVEVGGLHTSLLSQDDALDHTLGAMAGTLAAGSLYEATRLGGGSSVMENLQAQLKLREGELAQLQLEISALERSRSVMAEELVRLTNQNEDMEAKVKEIPRLRVQLKELEQRHNTILQMYGEKAEEAEELRLDLEDVKNMYKTQIDELLKNQK